MTEAATEPTKKPTSPTLDPNPIQGFLNRANQPPKVTAGTSSEEKKLKPAETKSDSSANPAAAGAANQGKEPAGAGEPKAEAAPNKSEATKDAISPGSAEWYKQLSEKHEGQYKELQKHTSRVETQSKQLGAQVAELQKLLKGDEEKERELTDEEKKLRTELQTKEAISKAQAIKEHGEEKIQQLIYEAEGPFRQLIQEKPWLPHRLAKSDAPVFEALAILAEEQVFKDLGRTPEEIRTRMAKELRESHFEEFRKEHEPSPANKGTGSPGLTDVRGDETRDRTGHQSNQTFSLAGLGGYIKR